MRVQILIDQCGRCNSGRRRVMHSWGKLRQMIGAIELHTRARLQIRHHWRVGKAIAVARNRTQRASPASRPDSRAQDQRIADATCLATEASRAMRFLLPPKSLAPVVKQELFRGQNRLVLQRPHTSHLRGYTALAGTLRHQQTRQVCFATGLEPAVHGRVYNKHSAQAAAQKAASVNYRMKPSAITRGAPESR